MNLQGPNLTIGARGESIAQLHAELLALGLDLPDNELQAGFYGKGTRAAVLAFQEQRGLKPTGVVDDRTARVLAAEHDSAQPRLARGVVLGPDGAPLAGVVVRAFDQNLTEPPQLAESAPTGEDGRYEVTYTTAKLGRAGKANADLLLRAFRAGSRKPLAQSDVIFGAGPHQTVDLVAGGAVKPAAQYDGLRARLAPALAGQELARLTDAQAAYVAGSSGVELPRLKTLALGERLAAQTGLPAAAFHVWLAGDAPDAGAAPEATMDRLLARPVAGLLAALEQAVAGNVIAALPDTPENMAAILGRARADRLLRPGQGYVSLGDMTGMLRDEAAIDNDAAGALVRLQDTLAPGDDLWAGARAGGILSEAQIGGLQSLVALQAIAGGDAALLAAARDTLPLPPAEALPSPLLRVAAMEPSDWLAALRRAGVDAPAAELQTRAVALTDAAARLMPADFLLARAVRAPRPEQLAPQLDDLARLRALNDAEADILRRPFDSLKTGDMADDEKQRAGQAFGALQRLANLHRGLELDRVLTQDGPAEAKIAEVRRRIGLIARVVELNPQTDFLALDYLPDSADRKALRFGDMRDADRERVRASLKAQQRAFRATGSARLAAEALGAGFDSAAAIAAATAGDFYQRSGLNPAEATSVHARARDVATDAGLQLMAIRDYLQPPGNTINARSPTSSLNPASPIVNYLRRLDGFDKLFGRLSSCRCEHCNSIFSPAAYFVDLMRFVDKHVTSQVFTGTKAGHSLSLPRRRPDLWTLEFTCENTHTPIPTLDIINEILENTVEGELDPTPQRRPAIQRAAYARLARATDSFRQPFVLPLRRLETYLSHFERSRADVARALGVDADTYARARLGLSVGEWQLLAPDPPAVDRAFLKRLYGETITVGLNRAKEIDVQAFLKLTDWTRAELQQLLAAEFVRQSNPVTFISRKRDAQSVQNDLEVVRGLDLALLDRLHRFTRLWRKVGWRIADLDQALYHFSPAGAPPVLGAAQLHSVAALADLLARFPALSPEEALALVADFPPAGRFGRPRPLFDRLFNLEPFVTQDGRWPADPATNPTFTHPAYAAGQSQPDNPTLQRLLAGLQVDDQELIDLMGGLNLLAADKKLPLTVANLSLLYRHARLARLLRLSVPQLLQLLALRQIVAVDGPKNLSALLALADNVPAGGFSADELAVITGQAPLRPDDFPTAESLAAAIARAVRAERLVEFDATVFTQLPGVTEAESRDFVARNSPPAGAAFEFVAASQRWRMPAAFDPADAAVPLNQPNPVRVPAQAARELLAGFHPRGFLPARLAAALGLPAANVPLIAALAGPLLTAHNTALCAELQPGDPDRPAPQLTAIVRVVQPLALLFRGPAWDEAGLAFVRANPGLFGLAIPARPGNLKLSLTAALRVSAYARLTTTQDVDFTPEKPRPDAAAVRAVLQKGLSGGGAATDSEVAAALRVSESRIAALRPYLTLGNEPFAALARLEACLGEAAFLGVSGETLKLIVPSAPTPQRLTVDTEYAALTSAAEGLYGVIRAKYPDEATFLRQVEPYEDQTRGLKRDGLVEYLIRSSGKDFASADDLYQFLLIDTQMAGCARTSRVVAANSSLQLYVHRVLMNLEQSRRAPDPNPDPNPIHVTPGRIPAEWQWRKNYRVWEANRKVFLNPENYIEPELRDDKTPLFEELEANLLQQHVGEDSATEAYADYLRGFEEVAELKIAGAYHDVRSQARRDILHLFGVTPSDPPVHYYRTIENARYGQTERDRRMTYRPWRKVDVQIPVRKVAPIVYRGRLYVFWVQITTQPRTRLFDGGSEFLGYRHKFNLNYTVAQLNGSWTAPQTIRQTRELIHDEEHPRDHNEPRDDYTLTDPRWEQVYPHDAGYRGLLITGLNFGLVKRVDFYEKALNDPAALRLNDPAALRLIHPVVRLSFTYPGDRLSFLYLQDYYYYSAVIQGARWLLSSSVGFPISSGGPYPTRSRVLEDLGLSMGRLPDDLLTKLAQLQPAHELMIINDNYMTRDCLIDAGGDLLWLQGPDSDPPKYQLRRLGTTLSRTMGRRLVEGGLNQLLGTDFQTSAAMKEPPPPITLERGYVTDQSNKGRLDFTGPYGVYYREIFFHIPFLIANHLNSQQRFAAAQRWYHHIFDPTSDDSSQYRVWRYLEFRQDLKPAALREALTDPNALEAYRADPFNPHAIARLRLSAYQKAIVMKYIDNLLDWGDSLFAEFTMESVNEATMLYTMAADILGPRPDDVGDCGEGQVSPKNYRRVAPLISEVEEILIELEHLVQLENRSANRVKETWRTARFGLAGVARIAISDTAGAVAGDGPGAGGGPGLAPAGLPVVGGAPVANAGLPARPLDWRRPGSSTWTTTGGTDLRGFSSYGGGNGGDVVPGLTPAGEGGVGPRPQITGNYGPGLPGVNPNLPPGSLKPEDYKKHMPWEWQLPERPLDGVVITPPPPQLEPINPSDIVPEILLFCIPDNKELRAYWDRVEDRLRKIRNCMDITGARRQLSLFAPEIDPRLLVRLRASGLSLEDVLSVTAGSVPPYRFTFLIDKAKQYAATVQSLGGALLSAMEKKDVEELGQLRAIHEQNLLNQRSRIMEWEIEAAEDTLESMRRQKTAAEYRRDHYGELLGTDLLSWERTQQISRHIASGLHATEAIFGFLAGGLGILPQFGAPTAMKYGGVELKEGAKGFWVGMQALASVSEAASASAGLEAGFQRRGEEWEHQKASIDKEIYTLKKQIEAAEIRVDIAQRSKEVHEKTIAQAEEVFEFLRDKFSSFGLYTYLSSMLSRRYREAYNAAYAVARMAEQAFRFERPGDAAGLLTNDYWDAQQAGLLAGERLLLDLQNLERRFLETNYRTLEIEQSFSLMQFDPAALLTLRQTGSCQFTIPELFFDLTYPGHYLRRIKGVRLTIPCVTGPYTNVGAELQLDASSIRLQPQGALDPQPLRHTRAIAASSAQNDAGVFEFSFRDERYMPFEGAGAVSTWTLTLPGNFRPFDYQTISDVVVRLSYTAEADAGRRTDVEKLAGTLRAELAATGLPRVYSLRHDFPDVWRKLTSSPMNTPVDLVLTAQHLPYLFTALGSGGINLVTSPIELRMRAKSAPAITLTVDGQSLAPPGGGPAGPDRWARETMGLYKAETAALSVIGTHTLMITAGGPLAPAPAIDTTDVADILVGVTLKLPPAPP